MKLTNTPPSIINNLSQEKIPTIGICFGHQLIAESLGGRVEKATDKGWGVGVHIWKIINKREWMGDYSPADFSLRASHQDQVVEMPAESTLYASSDFCPIAGFQIGTHVLSMQGHPEFSKEYNRALIEKRVDRIGEKVVDIAIQSLKKEVDSNTVTAWMIDFIKLSK